MKKKIVNRVVKYIVLIAFTTFVISNIVNVRGFDTSPILNLTVNHDELSWSPNVSFDYKTNNVDRVAIMVSYIKDDQVVGTNMLGSYVLNTNFSISNFEIFNLFNKIIGRKTPDEGLISLSIDSDENVIYAYASSYDNKSEESTMSMANLFSGISFKDYSFS